MKGNEIVDLFHQVARLALLVAQAESLDNLAPHVSFEDRAHLLDELLEADDENLDDATALRLADKQNKDVSVDWYHEAELLDILNQEVVETLNYGLNCR